MVNKIRCGLLAVAALHSAYADADADAEMFGRWTRIAGNFDFIRVNCKVGISTIWTLGEIK